MFIKIQNNYTNISINIQIYKYTNNGIGLYNRF